MYGDDEQCRDHFASVVLIEAVVSVWTNDSLFPISYSRTLPIHTARRKSHGTKDYWSSDGEALLRREVVDRKVTRTRMDARAPLAASLGLHWSISGTAPRLLATNREICTVLIFDHAEDSVSAEGVGEVQAIR